MTDVLLDTGSADVVQVYEPADVLIDVLGTNRVSVFAHDVIHVLADVIDPATSGVIEIITPGPSGPQGDVGDKGETGPTGPSPMYDQVFAVPEMVWVVIHPLETKPVVTTVDQNGEEIIGDVAFPDNSTVIITFGLPFAGTARLKA